MPDVAGGAASAAEHLASHDQTGADAGAHLDVEQRVDVVEPRAPVLAEGHHVDVVVDEDRSGETPGEPAADVEIVPPGHDWGRTGRPLVKSTGPGTPSPVAQTASRSWPDAARSASKWASTSVSTSSGPSAIGKLDRTRRDANAAEVGDRERAVGGAEVGTEDHPGPRVEREPSRWSTSGGGSRLHHDELVMHQLFEALSQRRAAEAGDLDQLGAGRGAPRADVLEHLPGGGGCEPRLADTSFGHGAHSNRRDLRCQAQKYVLTMEKVFLRVRPVCRRNSGWRSSGWASWAARTHAPPDSPGPGSWGSRRRHRSGPRRQPPAWALIARSRAPTRW